MLPVDWCFLVETGRDDRAHSLVVFLICSNWLTVFIYINSMQVVRVYDDYCWAHSDWLSTPEIFAHSRQCDGCSSSIYIRLAQSRLRRLRPWCGVSCWRAAPSQPFVGNDLRRSDRGVLPASFLRSIGFEPGAFHGWLHQKSENKLFWWMNLIVALCFIWKLLILGYIRRSNITSDWLFPINAKDSTMTN